MAKVKWDELGSDIAAAISGVLGADWKTISGPAKHQVDAMLAVARDIELDFAAGALDQGEYESLKAMQKTALEGILKSYQGIGIVAAQQAAAAAWDVVAAALRTAGLPFAI